jgi:hypothetical protein
MATGQPNDGAAARRVGAAVADDPAGNPPGMAQLVLIAIRWVAWLRTMANQRLSEWAQGY